MVAIITIIKVWDNSPIDTSSTEIKNKISQSVSNYILDHWDECVHTNAYKSDKKYNVDFSVTL